MPGGLGFLLAAAAFSGSALAYPDQPPPAHTGGFGEPDCRACHFEQPLNAADGVLTLAGTPAAYRPGASYELTVSLTRPGMRNAGFQLAARYAEGAARGRQAGSLQSLNDDVGITETSGVQYAQHNGIGSAESARWRLQWTAPADGERPVVFHLAGNAGNDDASAFGDFVYAVEIIVPQVSTDDILYFQKALLLGHRQVTDIYSICALTFSNLQEVVLRLVHTDLMRSR